MKRAIGEAPRRSPAPSAVAALGLLFGVLGVLDGGSQLARAQTPPVEVVVRAEAPLLEHARGDASLASSVVSGERLREAGTSAADVLMRVPGVQVTRTGAQSDLATASIRGADATQVPIYLGGVRVNDDADGTADLSTIPLWMIERVEVFRGNAPEHADRLGIGGAIFFWPRLPRTPRASIGQGAGSFGERSQWGSLEAGNAQVAVLGSLRRSGADNDYPFVNDQGQRFDLDEHSERRANADFDQIDGWLVGRLRLGDGARTHTLVHALDREQGMTGLSAVPARFARGRTRRLLAGQSTHVPCGDGGCSLELSSSFALSESTLTDPFVELPSLRTRRLESRGERTDHALFARLEGAEHELGASLLVSFARLEVDRAESRPHRADRSSLAPRATARVWITPRLQLGALLGLECHATSGVGVELSARVVVESEPCRLLEPVGRLTARYQTAFGPELLANAARYVRLPSLSELYGASPNVEGNSRLGPERGLSADVGLRHSFSGGEGAPLRASVEAFAFLRGVDGLVRYRRSGVQVLTPFNVASARLLGVEAAVAAELLQVLRLESSVTALDPRETTDDPALDPTVNDVLPNTSRLTLALGAQLEQRSFPAATGLERARFGLRYLHRSSRFEDAAGQNVLPAQDFVDLELALDFAREHLRVRLATKNLFDWRGSDLIGLPVPGRSYHATAEGWF